MVVKRFQTVIRYGGNMGKVLICDIDGCVIDTSSIWIDAGLSMIPEDKKFEFFEKQANNYDNPVCWECVNFVNAFKHAVDKIMFMTARSEVLREGTLQRLKDVINVDFTLMMRPLDNKDDPALLKESMLMCVQDEHKVVLAIDDNKEICEMYEEHGIPNILWEIGKYK